jgi:hypothetical protein
MILLIVISRRELVRGPFLLGVLYPLDDNVINSGKTTYCQGIQMFMHEMGRSCDIINMDFANEKLPYKAAVDVRDLISLQVKQMIHSSGIGGG